MSDQTNGHSRSAIPTLVKDAALVEQRRAEIVRAAVALFIRKGFHATTTREIAQAFGLSIGALYQYVRSKEHILLLVFEQITARRQAGLREVLAEAPSGREALERAVRHYLHVVDEQQDYALLIYQELKSLDRAARAEIMRREEDLAGLFEQILARGVADGSLRVESSAIRLLAHDIMVLSDMWAFRRWAFHRQYSLDQFVEQQLGLILAGAGAPDPARPQQSATLCHSERSDGSARSPGMMDASLRSA